MIIDKDKHQLLRISSDLGLLRQSGFRGDISILVDSDTQIGDAIHKISELAISFVPS